MSGNTHWIGHSTGRLMQNMRQRVLQLQLWRVERELSLLESKRRNLEERTRQSILKRAGLRAYLTGFGPPLVLVPKAPLAPRLVRSMGRAVR